MGKSRQIIRLVNAVKDKKLGRILVFTGARQVGKTSLVKNVLRDYTYLSIEDPVARQGYVGLTAAQWKSLYPKAALDEVQKEPQLIESIKSAYDQYDDVRYLLLGSSQLLLLEKVKESLAGRCVLFDMYPLTLPELSTTSWDDVPRFSIWQQLLQGGDGRYDFLPSFLIDPHMAQKQQAWEHYVRFGGYPALVDESMTDDDRYLWLTGYVRTYLERDVRDLASFRDLEPFVKLQHAVALQTAQALNASALAGRVGITSKTVQRYIEYLGVSYQTLLLPAWERNKNKRLTKMPKVHYLDNGVLQAVLQKRGGMTGAEFESLVIAELYKQAKNLQAPVSFFHLRTHDGKEVDLLVETEQGYYAFEIKMTDHVQPSDARHLVALETLLDKPVLQAYVLSNDYTTRSLADGVLAVNVNMLLG